MHGVLRQLTVVLWLGMALFSAVWADDPPSFGLQPTAGGTWNGPYRFEPDGAFILNGHVFEIKIDVDDRFRIRSLESEEVFGPFERVPGRILKIQGVAYVLTEGADPEAPLIHAPVPVAPPPVVPDFSQETSAAVDPRQVPAEPGSPPKAGPDPRTPARPLQTPALPKPAPSVPPTPLPQLPAIDPPQHTIGVFSTFAESAAYEWRISDVEGATSIDLERELIGISYRQAMLDVSAGLIRDSSGAGPVTGFPAFDEFRLGPVAGDGWRLACRLSGSAWNTAWMDVVYQASLVHTREDWNLPYTALRFSMQPVVTGATGSFIRVAEASEGTTTTEFTETAVSAGGGIRLHKDRWLGQVMADYRLIESIGVKPSPTILRSDIDLDLETEDPVLVVIGGGVRLSEVTLMAEVGLTGRTGITIGMQYEF